MSKKQYTVSSRCELLHAIFISIPSQKYSSHSDVELCALIHDSSQRSEVSHELLRRHSPLIAAHVMRFYNRGVGGCELCDYESLAVMVALSSYESYDASRSSSPSSYMYGLVLRRLSDAQSRTSLESDCRWPLVAYKYSAWLRGDYDYNPAMRQDFEKQHNLTEQDRSHMLILYGHLLKNSHFCTSALSLESVLETSHHDGLIDSSAANADVIINRVLLDQALSSLSDELDRRILHLFAVDGCPLVEIAKNLDMNLHEVRKSIKRSRDHCRKVLR